MSDFILKLEPNEKIVFTGKVGEEAVPTTLKITNTTQDRQVCKVKCTSNEMFKIRPPVFALKPGEEGIVKLTFNAGKTVPENGKHYFVVYYIKSTDETKNPRACWADHKDDPDGTKRLYVDFKDEGEGDKKDEEGDKKEGEGEKKEGEGEKNDGDGEKKEGEAEKKEDEGEKKEGDGEKKEEEKKDEEQVRIRRVI
uniref:Major sperm protein n=1 Tax=Ascaris lumbricoides TaxID=6252 RepID=A0A0M3I7M2_ASCLU